MGKSQRKKGHEYERAIVRYFKALGFDARRVLEYQEAYGYDVVVENCLAIQCKRWKNYAPVNKIEEVDAPEMIPALVTKADRKKPIICLYLDDFIKLMRLISCEDN